MLTSVRRSGRLSVARRVREDLGVDPAEFRRGLVRGSRAPADTPQLRATIALTFFLVWTLTASVGLLIRTTSETHHLTAVLGLLASVYLGAVAVLVAGKRLSRRAFNIPTAVVTVIVAVAQYL